MKTFFLPKVFFFSLIFLSIGICEAQDSHTSVKEKYWVFLKNKKDVKFDPYIYFDARTIIKRIQYNIPILDSTDFPLNSTYCKTVSEIVDSVSKTSRWFNVVSVYATNEQVEKLLQLPFVKSVEPMILRCVEASYAKQWDTISAEYQRKLLEDQTAVMGDSLFRDKGINGKGVRIAVFDAGFPTVDKNPAFEHIFKEGRIIKTWDFTKNKEFVYDYNEHGCMVLSCIAGIINNKKMGLATGAEFLLARTEVEREPFSEEENWLAAAEWADKNGVDIINSSLGYTYHRYFPTQMDGKSTLVTRAANMAARKGMLVVNAAGNDGDNKWRRIGSPADADSVLSVGGINPETGYHTSFSSFGPTWDKRMKPNVCAFGHVIASGKNGLVSSQGTSFSSPLVAGFAACAWQTNRTLNNMQLFKEIEESGNLFPYFDYAHGYGIPQAEYFVKPLRTKNDSMTVFEIQHVDDFVIVHVMPDFIDNYGQSLTSYLYYNIENPDGVLDEYLVVKVETEQPLKLFIPDYKKGQKLNVYYKNVVSTYLF